LEKDQRPNTGIISKTEEQGGGEEPESPKERSGGKWGMCVLKGFKTGFFGCCGTTSTTMRGGGITDTTMENFWACNTRTKKQTPREMQSEELNKAIWRECTERVKIFRIVEKNSSNCKSSTFSAEKNTGCGKKKNRKTNRPVTKHIHPPQEMKEK